MIAMTQPTAASQEPKPKRPKKATRPNTAINLGIHPAIRIPLAPTDGLTHRQKARCETCIHLQVAYEGRTVTDHTCDLIDQYIAVEPEWPACVKHEPRKK